MINFAKVEQSVRALKSQLAAGQINQQNFESQLMAMVDIAPDGYYWMFGHETGQWYQHDGQQWIPKDPGKLRMLTPKEDNSSPGANPHNPHSRSESAEEPGLVAAWQSVAWGPFVAGLIVLGIIGWLVYTSV